LELVGATVVGRHASLVAALAVYCSAMLVYAVSGTLALVVLDLPARGSALMSLSIAGTGIVFAGVAAVSSQVAGTARMANGIAGMLIGVAFLLRGVGAVTGSLADDKLGVVLAWPAWLSPLAWGDLSYPFTAQRWWVLIAFPLTFAALATTAVALSARRDLGRGMIPVRAGRPEARRWLLSPLGLALRLQRGLWVAWAVGAAVMGVTTGLFTNAFEDLLADNDAARAMFTAVGGSDALRDNAFALMMTWVALMFVVYVLQAVLHLHSEEGGPLESVLATATGRVRWMASHLIVAAVGATLLLLVAGGTAGASAALVADDVTLLSDLLAAAMVQLPAVLLVGAVCALAYGVSARLAAPVGWGAFALCLFTLIGDLFRVPDRVLDLSPFAHVPLLPAEPFTAGPLLWMLAASVASICVGALLFRRRDIGLP
jgi:ABC-2 type transport system permease protein